jgi:hypothetical protein
MTAKPKNPANRDKLDQIRKAGRPAPDAEPANGNTPQEAAPAPTAPVTAVPARRPVMAVPTPSRWGDESFAMVASQSVVDGQKFPALS